MKERTPEMETAALLRRLKRQGVREVEWDSGQRGSVVLRAKVQVGRAHRQLTTKPHETQEEALAELSQLVAVASPRPARASKAKVVAQRLARPAPGQERRPTPRQRDLARSADGAAALAAEKARAASMASRGRGGR